MKTEGVWRRGAQNEVGLRRAVKKTEKVEEETVEEGWGWSLNSGCLKGTSVLHKVRFY